jgi:phosphatidylethanolamine-binding protein (PEBP) family uncharacterized protein
MVASYGNLPIDGSELNVDRTQREPQISWPVDSADKRYTIMMTDPDVPRGDGRKGEWLHWLVMNIPGNIITAGSQIIPYQGPTPPSGSGLHHYYVRVYSQDDRVEPSDIKINSRSGFDRSGFEKKFKLREVGKAYFTAQHY